MVILHPSAYAGLPVLRDIELTSPSAFRNDQIQALVPLAPDALAAWLSTDPPPNQQAPPQDRLLVDQLSQFRAETTFLCRHGGTGDDTVLVWHIYIMSDNWPFVKQKMNANLLPLPSKS